MFIGGFEFHHFSEAMRCSLYLILIEIIGIYLHRAASECDPDVGPAGGTICLLDSPPYDRAQYATCVSHEYILQKSFGEQGCNDSVSYCYYPCMLERYGVDEGAVERDCTCDVGGSVDIMTGLPAECRIPAPSDCSWYNNCLKKYYPCSVRQEYSLGFGERICTAYNQSSLSSTQCGLEWFQSVSQCILVQTSSLIRNYSLSNQTASNEACLLYEKSILKEQSRCYLDSYGAFSICQLDCSVFALMFNSIQTALTLERGRYSFALKNLIISAKSCPDIFTNSTCSSGRFLEIRSRIRSNSQFFQNISGYEDLVSASIVDSIAQNLYWASYADLKWHAYASMQALPTPSKELNIQLSLFELSSGVIYDVVRVLVNWIASGSSVYVSNFDTAVDMVSLKSCEPQNEMENCNQILTQASQSSSSQPSTETSRTTPPRSTTTNMAASSPSTQPRSSESRSTVPLFTPAMSSASTTRSSIISGSATIVNSPISTSFGPSTTTSTTVSSSTMISGSTTSGSTISSSPSISGSSVSSSSSESSTSRMTKKLPMTPALSRGFSSSVSSTSLNSESSSTMTSNKESITSGTTARSRRQTPAVRYTPPISTASKS